MRQYTKEDIDYNVWYSDWAKRLALTNSLEDLKTKLTQADSKRNSLSSSHLKAIEKSTSMTSNSQRRAQTRNSMSGNYELYTALISAIEIYELFPEYTLSFTISLHSK